MKDFLQDKRKVAGTIAGVVVLIILSILLYIQSTPEYALYQLQKAAKSGDTAAFAKLYQPSGQPVPEGERLSAFKKSFQSDLSLPQAFTQTEKIKEGQGGVILITKAGGSEVAFRLEREGGTWRVLDATSLTQ